MDIVAKLDKEIVSAIEAMRDIAVESEEYKIAAENVAKLISLRNETVKLEIEAEDKAVNHEREIDLKEKQFKSEKRDRIAKNCISAIVPFGQLALIGWMTAVSINFEKEGTFSTLMGRGVVNNFMKLLPTKK